MQRMINLEENKKLGEGRRRKDQHFFKTFCKGFHLLTFHATQSKCTS